MQESSLIRLFLLGLSLTGLVHSTCGPGTLRCVNPADSTNSRAVICDPSLNYVLFKHSCIQQIIPNCILTIDENKCKVCQFGRCPGALIRRVLLDQRPQVRSRSAENALGYSLVQLLLVHRRVLRLQHQVLQPQRTLQIGNKRH